MFMLQKDIFLKTEGDEWYKRNEKNLKKFKSFVDVDQYIEFISNKNKVLEIGCASGKKLEYLHKKTTNKNLYGIDPSINAIESGEKNFPYLNLSVGTADEIFYENNFFDIIIVGFCFYLIDREIIFKVISEIDRLLKQGGKLIITDFEVPYPYKNKYVHTDNVFSYKNDYSSFFTGGKHYTTIKKFSFSHRLNNFDNLIDERISTTILHKENLNDLYNLK